MMVSRRHVLQGLAAGAALPWLWPRTARSDTTPPRRLLVFVVPNGMPDAWWTPTGVGAGWMSTGILDPLEAVRDEVAVVSGLGNVPDYPTDHSESMQLLLYGGRAAQVGVRPADRGAVPGQHAAAIPAAVERAEHAVRRGWREL